MSTVLSNRWIQKRTPYWERLTALVASAQHSTGGAGIKNLSRAELREMALLYRQVASDLSTLRQDRTSAALAAQVNALLARAHHIIYSSRKSTWRNFLLFLRDGYPAVFRKQRNYVFVSLILLLGGALIATAFTLNDSRFGERLAGPMVLGAIARHEMWTRSIVSVAPQATSAIMTNNLSVSFIAFAGGLTFGALSVFEMFQNGLLLGAIGVLCGKAGMAVDLWSFVAPHGSLELPAIVIAGAAGLRLGYGMLFPGMYRWKDSVAHAGREAVRLASGLIPLLIIAGTLEGFFSPSSSPVWLKFTVGGALFSLLLLWLFRPLPKTVIEI
jgi:uncharacterized membrane protein SpoIIM required for sporulation